MAAYPNSGRNFKKRNDFGPRRNERIKATQVRVIGPDGSQIGVISRDEALRLAKGHGMDLLEVSANTNPPVCKILDYGKFKYEEDKKQRTQKPHAAKLKEIKLGLNIEPHDYETKLRHGEDFLYKGNKLKISLMLRGRQMEQKTLAFDVVMRACKDLEGVGFMDGNPTLAGKNIIVTLTPLAANKRKLKFNLEQDEPPAEGPDEKA
ncbi:MAG: translation initiation factor IF-3 [Verrucomicrobia bacterium GWF2_51_19]|nr:MAG: translation initiation factor IF-3 [Verrucomicrobia bacterium GWF2_51_19]HCJ12159.1 translation initiation factor IF-3 [Opitutae bacterium]